MTLASKHLICLRAALAWLWLASCAPQPEKVQVGPVTLDCPATLLLESLSPEATRGLMAKALEQSTYFLLQGREAHEKKAARLHLALLPSAYADRPLEITARLTLKSVATPSRQATTDVRLYLLSLSSGALLEALDEVLPETLFRLHAKFGQQNASSQALVHELTAHASWRREGAARVLASPSHGFVVPALLHRLRKEPDAACQLALVSALVAHRERRAVPHVIEAMQRKEPQFVAQLTYALAALGGRMAEGYLVNLAAGHPHQAVRESARNALSQLEEVR